MDAAAYLPSFETVSIYFLKDIIGGVKKCKLQSHVFHITIVVKCQNVKHIFIPQFEGLSVENIGAFLTANPQSYEYFPVQREIRRLPK